MRFALSDDPENEERKVRYSPYPKYKPSGVEWLGEVPAHWEVKKISHGFRKIGSGTTPKSDSTEYYDGDVPWVTTSELRESVITKTKQSVTHSALVDYATLRLYPVGTLLFAMYGATIGRLGILGLPATVNQACCAFAFPLIFETRFVYYWLWVRRPILISLSSGGGQPNLNQDDLRQIQIPIPPLPEQRAIADFLDRETAKLDTLVAKKRELIEKLKEKRTALISRTVTRGLPPEAARAAGFDPHPKLKSSCIEWLGEVPEHWEVKRVKHLGIIRYGLGEPPEYVDEGLAFIRATDIKRGKFDLEAVRKVSPADVPWSRCPLLLEDEILIVRSGAYTGDSAIVTKEVTGSIAGYDMVLTVTMGVPHFVAWVFLSKYMLESQIHLSRLRAAQPHLNAEELSNFIVLIPPISEQRAIADYLDRETAKIDQMTAKVEEAIARLQEYRTALITAAVTGKIEVRQSAVKEAA